MTEQNKSIRHRQKEVKFDSKRDTGIQNLHRGYLCTTVESKNKLGWYRQNLNVNQTNVNHIIYYTT